jgi:hypothetical protein
MGDAAAWKRRRFQMPLEVQPVNLVGHRIGSWRAHSCVPRRHSCRRLSPGEKIHHRTFETADLVQLHAHAAKATLVELHFFSGDDGDLMLTYPGVACSFVATRAAVNLSAISFGVSLRVRVGPGQSTRQFQETRLRWDETRPAADVLVVHTFEPMSDDRVRVRLISAKANAAFFPAKC